jgi:hypothetical protein
MGFFGFLSKRKKPPQAVVAAAITSGPGSVPQATTQMSAPTPPAPAKEVKEETPEAAEARKQAATKIAAIQRGKQSRSGKQLVDDKTPTAEPTPAKVEAKAETPEEEAARQEAATKIAAIQRGKLARGNTNTGLEQQAAAEPGPSKQEEAPAAATSAGASSGADQPAEGSTTSAAAPPAKPKGRRRSVSTMIMSKKVSGGLKTPPTREEMMEMLPETMPEAGISLLGKWQCKSISKEYDTFLYDIGIPWLARKAMIPLAKSKITFLIKSFSDEEVKKFESSMTHSDGNPLLGCKYTVLGKSEMEPLAGFKEPMHVGHKILEPISRRWEGGTLVTSRDFSFFKNFRSAQKAVDTELRVYTEPGENGGPERLVEEVTWDSDKKYFRRFERIEKFDMWEAFLGKAPKRPDGEYYVWTKKGVDFFASQILEGKDAKKNAQMAKMIGFLVGVGFHQRCFDMVYKKTGGGEDPSDVYDWERMKKEGMIKDAGVVPPDLPEEPVYLLTPFFCQYMIEYYQKMGAIEGPGGAWMFCEGILQIAPGKPLNSELYKIAYVSDPIKMATPDEMCKHQLLFKMPTFDGPPHQSL